LRKLKTSIGKKIDPRTVCNHFNNTVAFLNTYGRKELIPQNEWPAYEEKKVVAYDPEVLAHMLKFADEDEADVLEFFLGVNFRNGEGAHVEWPDINLRTKEVKVYSKRERFGWQVKDSEQRNIGINDKLAERLVARHKRYRTGLAFSNSKGNADTHLLRIIKNVALRAGLNCGGSCINWTSGCGSRRTWRDSRGQQTCRGLYRWSSALLIPRSGLVQAHLCGAEIYVALATGRA
jgi:hypothetical protein